MAREEASAGMKATDEEKRQVEEILQRVAGALEIDRAQARKLLHRYVCGGTCDWYTTRRNGADFEMGGLTDRETAVVRQAVSDILDDPTPEQAWYVIHGVLCEGHPRSHAKPPERMIH